MRDGINPSDLDDDVTLYRYDVAGHLSQLARKAPGSGVAGVIDEDEDAVTDYAYDELSQDTKVDGRFGSMTGHADIVID